MSVAVLTNAGTITAYLNSTLNFGGDFTLADLVFNRSGGTGEPDRND